MKGHKRRKKRLRTILTVILVILIQAKRAGLFCARRYAKGIAEIASRARIQANQITYSLGSGYSIPRATSPAENETIIRNRRDEIISEIIPVLNTFSRSFSCSLNRKKAVSIP